jgi:hypothetical protein
MGFLGSLLVVNLINAEAKSLLYPLTRPAATLSQDRERGYENQMVPFSMREKVPRRGG